MTEASSFSPAIQFLLDELKKNPQVTYQECQAGAAALGINIAPVNYGRARKLAGLTPKTPEAPATPRVAPTAPAPTAAAPTAVAPASVDGAAPAPAKRKPGRPKGSTNKKKAAPTAPAAAPAVASAAPNDLNVLQSLDALKKIAIERGALRKALADIVVAAQRVLAS